MIKLVALACISMVACTRSAPPSADRGSASDPVTPSAPTPSAPTPPAPTPPAPTPTPPAIDASLPVMDGPPVLDATPAPDASRRVDAGAPPAVSDASVPTPQVTCGKATCAAGQVCCNASCGICTPPGRSCIQMVCDEVPAPLPSPAPSPSPAACKADADCRAHASYCEGCTCLALGASAPAPTCATRPVNCLVDPCRAQTAVCRSGRCTLTTN